MKLIKFLLLFSIAIGNVIFAMDFESKTEKLPKSDLTPEQFKQEWNKLKTKKELEKITGKDVTSFQDTQKIIAQKIITPVIAYIVKKPSFAELKHGRFNRNAYVVTAAFSADGNKLAVVVEEQNLFAPGSKIIVWDVITASKLAEINPKDFSAISTKLHARQVNSIAFSPDGKKLVTGSQDGTVKIWNIQTKKEENIFTVYPKGAGFIKKYIMRDKVPVDYVSFNSDGSRVFVIATDRTKRVFDIKTSKQIGLVTNVKVKKEYETIYERAIDYDKEFLNRGVMSPNEDKVAQLEKDGKTILVFFSNQVKALQWLINKLPGQQNLPKEQRFLSPDQAEIIRKMYEAHKDNEKFTIDMKDAVRFSKMPTYVKDMLKFYFGSLIEKKK